MKTVIVAFLFGLYSVALYNLLTRKHSFRELIIDKKGNETGVEKLLSKPFFVVYELIVSVAVIFFMSKLDLTYFLPEAWPSIFYIYYTYIVFFIVASLLVLVATIFHYYLYFKKKDKYKEHYLIRIKTLKLLPLTSAFYAAIAFFVVIAGLTIIELTSDYSDWIKQENLINENLALEKFFDAGNDDNLLNNFETGYPPVKILNTQLDTEPKVKILVVGDSFVWGSGNSNKNYLWWNQLQNELDKRGYDCIVYGVGWGGSSTYDELRWLTKSSMIEDLDPDIIIMGYVINDAVLPDNYLNPKGWLNFSDVTGLPVADIFSSFFPSVFQILKYKVNDKFASYAVFNNDNFGYQYKNWQLQLVSDEHLKRFKKHVAEPLGDFVKSIDIPVLLLTTPEIPDKKFYQARYEPILPLFTEAGLKVYDSLGYFCLNYSDAKYENGYYINPVDGHPGTVSNMAYAAFMANKLEADYRSILGEKAIEKLMFNIKITDWMPYDLKPEEVSSGETKAEYKINYPEKNAEKTFLYLPVKEDYVKLNFKYPVDISAISISGSNLQSTSLYVTGINDDLGYDDQTMYKLGMKKGQSCEWTDNDSLYVTSLCIHAETFNGTSAVLSIVVTCKKGAVRP